MAACTLVCKVCLISTGIQMKCLLNNIIASALALAVAVPLLILFDISINAVFNPQYGVWSQEFLHGNVAILASVFMGLVVVVVPMRTHTYFARHLMLVDLFSGLTMKFLLIGTVLAAVAHHYING
jgi:hypothetical protein